MEREREREEMNDSGTGGMLSPDTEGEEGGNYAPGEGGEEVQMRDGGRDGSVERRDGGLEGDEC